MNRKYWERREQTNKELLEHVAACALQRRREIADGLKELLDMGRLRLDTPLAGVMEYLHKAKTPQDIIDEATQRPRK